MDFHRQISGARGVLGWSRKDLSQASGVSERAIEELEKGNAARDTPAEVAGSSHGGAG